MCVNLSISVHMDISFLVMISPNPKNDTKIKFNHHVLRVVTNSELETSSLQPLFIPRV